jgi:hypothetical protein
MLNNFAHRFRFSVSFLTRKLLPLKKTWILDVDVVLIETLDSFEQFLGSLLIFAVIQIQKQKENLKKKIINI